MPDGDIPASVDRLVALATGAIDRGEDEPALVALSEALEREPTHPGATWQVGRYYGWKEQWADAAEQFARAVRLDPERGAVDFKLRGERIVLRDGAGSSAPAAMLEEFARDLYDLRSRAFAPGDVVIDVGAHIGSVSILLAKLHPGLRIIAYEPSSHNFAMLQANLLANGVTNVTAVQEAVAGAAGTLELLWSPAQSANASSMLPAAVRGARVAAGWEQEQVQCVTLDQVFDRHRIDRCAFLKLDCEGAEWEIVRQATALERTVSAAVELHLPASRQGEGAEALQREFVALLTRRRRWPETKVPSIVWLLDS